MPCADEDEGGSAPIRRICAATAFCGATKASQHEPVTETPTVRRTCSSAERESGSRPASPTALIAVWNADAPACIPGLPFACAGMRRGEPWFDAGGG